jgi:uncharacterized membrane protein YphA (DoxX/SURF4 family)
MVGAVFVSEGLQKYLFPQSLGVGRFIKIGLPSPEILAPFVGAVEILCGSLLLLGFYARLASLPLLIVMIVAIVTTKIPVLPESGFWKMAHEARTDWSMLLGSFVVLLLGPGKWSVESLLRRGR